MQLVHFGDRQTVAFEESVVIIRAFEFQTARRRGGAYDAHEEDAGVFFEESQSEICLLRGDQKLSVIYRGTKVRLRFQADHFRQVQVVFLYAFYAVVEKEFRRQVDHQRHRYHDDGGNDREQFYFDCKIRKTKL